MKDHLAVIGGGISGITTAVTLQLLGYETVCYAKKLVGDEIEGDPCFASQYPAASVIPHSVDTDDLKQLFSASQSVFEKLYELKDFHVSKHHHYELYEFSREMPAYTSDLLNFSSLHEAREQRIPKRKNAPVLNGWSFDCYIAEWPSYIHQLYQLYQQLDGKIRQQEIQREEIANLPVEIIINCAGLGAFELADDPVSPQLIRGHLAHINDRPLVQNKNGQTVSYNYTPELSIYSTAGRTSDVYCYPINGQWILGGSRQYGMLDEDGNWQGEEYSDVIDIDGNEVPRPIITLNRDILSNTFDINLDYANSNVKSYTGYRFIREDDEQSLRLEPDNTGGKLMIHNYGHGGAGVTLSWGCALKVLQYIEQTGMKVPADYRLEKQLKTNDLKYHLRKMYSICFE
jgi:glycine/D-amino acid oxidase-like deaminating enzyme